MANSLTLVRGRALDCTTCGLENEAPARFCAECGTALAPACAGCGETLRSGAKFCVSCGTPVGDQRAEESAPAQALLVAQRKTITVVFGDVGGSTGLGERLDPEAAREVMNRYHNDVLEVIGHHGGVVDKFNGDGFMATFGMPEVAEDDAARAVAAAVEIQRRFTPFADGVAERFGGARISLRVGVNTGEVVVADDDPDIVGDALNVAARLERACPAGRVLVGPATWRLTRQAWSFEPQGEVTVAGRVEPVEVFVVREAALDDTEAATPFVGRDVEVATVRAAFDDAVEAGAARLVSIVGSPGLGKTRLAGEAVATLAAGAVYTVACERSGSSTLAPVIDLVRVALDVAERSGAEVAGAAVRELVAARIPDTDEHQRVEEAVLGVLGVGPARSTEEVFWAVRRMLEAVARRGPVVVVVDDVQWAEPVVLDLLEHLVEWVTDAPLLLVCLARPEIRELRPALTEPGRRTGHVIALEGLDAAATARLASGMLGSDAVPDALLERLPASTEGNPLFVRELVKMLVDDAVIRRRATGWELTIDADAVEVPPTIASLLAARIDRLGDDERLVLERASVIGPEFPEGALRCVVDVPGGLAALLERLRRMELVEPTGAYRGDEPLYRFHHVLIRDAAYRRLLKNTRAALHEQVAGWLEEVGSAATADADETIAFHEEQAHRYRSELGPLDDAGRALGRRAASRLHTAAGRALARDDLAAAGPLATRALACIGDDAAGRVEVLLLACEATLGSGDVAAGEELVGELDALAFDDRLRAWAVCFRAQLTELTDPGRLVEAEHEATHAAGVLAALRDEAGAAKGHLTRARILQALGRVGDAEDELDRALTAAREADDSRRITAVLGAAPPAAVLGPSPVPRAGGRCLDIVRLLRVTTRAPSVEATSMRAQGLLEAFRGRFDAARAMIDRARRKVDELGLRHESLQTELFAGNVEFLAGDLDAAEAALRSAYAGFASMRLGAEAGLAAALLARVLAGRGELDEADHLVDTAEEMVGRNLKAAVVSAIARAEIRLAQGRIDDGVHAARAAVDVVADTDLIADRADAHATLARALRATGDDQAADDEERKAGELAWAKGATAIATQPSATATADHDRLQPREARSTAHRRAAAELWDLDDTLVEARLATPAPFEAEVHPDLEVIDHRPGLRWSGGAELNLSGAGYRGATLAILGRRAALVHWSMQPTDDHDAAARFEATGVTVLSVDASGRARTFDRFDLEQADEAIDKLWERYHEHCADDDVEPVDNPAARVDLRGSVYLNMGQPSRATALLTPDYVHVDHRPGEPDLDRGTERLVPHGAGTDRLHGLPKPIETAGDDRALVVTRWTASADDGVDPFFFDQLYIATVDPEGRVRRLDLYHPDQLDDALADLRRGRSDAPSWDPLDSPLGRTYRVTRALPPSDERLREWHNDDLVYTDHRAGLRATLSPEALARADAEVVSDHWSWEWTDLAVLGDRAGLARMVLRYLHGDADEPFASEALWVNTVDADGRFVTNDVFDADDIDAALDLLWERYHEHCVEDGVEPVDNLAARGLVRQAVYFNLGQPNPATDSFSPEHVTVDHSPGEPDLDLGEWPRLILGSEGWTAMPKPLETAGDHCALIVARLSALAEDGVEPFYYEQLSVVSVGSDGHVLRADAYRLEQHDEARAELHRRTSSAPVWNPFDNLVVRSLAKGKELRHSADFAVFDHRSLVGAGAEGADEFAAEVSRVMSGGYRVRSELVASLGEHTALHRTQSTTDTDFETVFLVVRRCDEEGTLLCHDRFDLDDLDAALDLLWQRYHEDCTARGEDPLDNRAARVTLRSCALENLGQVEEADYRAPGYIQRDRRPLTIEADPDVHFSDAAPHRKAGWKVFTQPIATHGDRRVLRAVVHAAPADFGVEPFTVPAVVVSEVDGSGAVTRDMQYAPEQADEALTELRRGSTAVEPWDPEATPVVRLLRRVAEVINTGDHEALRRTLAADAVFRDHRSMFQLTGGPEAFTSAARGMRMAGLRLLLVGSDRVSLSHQRFERDEFEVDVLEVLVVDAEGLQTEAHTFDVEQLDDAVDEYLALSYGAEGMVNDAIATSSRVTARLNLGDVDGAVALFAEDFEQRGYRQLVGHPDGVDVAVLPSSLADSHRDGRIGLSRYVRSIGDRLALAIACSLYPNGFRSDALGVVESDGHGKLRARTFYDLDQYDHANADMERRATELQP